MKHFLYLTILYSLLVTQLGYRSAKETAGGVSSQPHLAAQSLPASAVSSCPVTIPNGSLPLSNPFPNPKAHHGNGAIWTVLPLDGILQADSRSISPDGSIDTKFYWWRGEKAIGRLSIEGRRLDATAPPADTIIPDGYGEIGFQSSGIIFPTEGCWEVTGKAGDARLTFIVQVVKRQDAATPTTVSPISAPIQPSPTELSSPTATTGVEVEPTATAVPPMVIGMPVAGNSDPTGLIVSLLLCTGLLSAGVLALLARPGTSRRHG